jgi:endonuclease YncB( thermonuclease family)
LAFLATVLSGCGSSSEPVSLTPDDLNTAETDALTFVGDYSGKDFLTDGIGLATLRSSTDGDTARFNVGSTNVPVRFLGINTPESTGKIQPWGKAASEFTKEKLTTATSIILINDRNLFGVTDSSGGRYLGFVWYQPALNARYRLLNLELVEQAYTENLLFDQSTVCDYFDAFSRAGAHASATGARIYGEDDPTFDYTDQVYDISIRFARAAYGETVQLQDREGNLVFDENEDPVMITLYDSTKIRVRAMFLGSIGNNMVIRDVYNPDEDGYYATVFVFTQYRGVPLATKAGDIIEFYCKATVFAATNSFQFTDPELTTYSQKYPFVKLVPGEAENFSELIATYGIAPEAANADPLDFTGLEVDDKTDFAPYNGFYVTANVTIRQVTFDEEDDPSYTYGDYWRKDGSDNMTIYAHFFGTDISFNLRIDGGLFPYVDYDWFELGASYEVSGYIAQFYENYQLQLLNDVAITALA